MERITLTRYQYKQNIKFIHRLSELKEKYQNNDILIQRINKLVEMRLLRTVFTFEDFLMVQIQQTEKLKYAIDYPDLNRGFKISDGYFPIINHII